MMRVIKVYGSLAKFLGQRSFRAAVSTPAEAMRFLIANFPGLREHMAEKFYKVGVGKTELAVGSEPEQLHYPAGKTEPICIVPVISGAKRGVWETIAGVVLIALSFVVPFAAPVLLSLGVGLTLSGVSQMLTPVPKMSYDETSPSKSYNFSGIQNVSRQGVPVPICYGEVLVGSVVVSAGINAEDI
jgi:predicted phage tail protein